ncbi:MAG: DUF192 domain-containing protein [Verrucomicrobiota bacterium]
MRPLWFLGLLLGVLFAAVFSQPASSGSKSSSLAANRPAAVPAATASAASASAEPVYHLDHALPKEPTSTLYIGATEVRAFVCTTLSQVATGMMHRDGVGPEEAMLFVFGGGDRRSFYMKNVSFDIAAAYIDTEGVVKEIVQLKKQEVTPVPSASADIQFVLETAPDWFTRHGVGPGTLIRAEGGSLRDVFGAKAVLR